MAREALRRSAGMARKTSYATLVIVGRIMRGQDKRPREPAEAEGEPDPGPVLAEVGDQHGDPQPPVDDGRIPTKTSIAGL